MYDQTLGVVTHALGQFVTLTERQAAVGESRQEAQVSLEGAFSSQRSIAPDAVDQTLVVTKVEQYQLLGNQFLFRDLHSVFPQESGELPPHSFSG